MKKSEEGRAAEQQESEIEEGRVSEPLPRLLAEIAEPNPEGTRKMTLHSGRVVESVAEGASRDRLTIKNPSGEIELEIRMTERGPLLKFRSADVELEATRDVKVSCNDFHVKAAGKIVEEAGGDLRQQIRGNSETKVRGKMRLAAREVDLEAKRGNVKIDANDDVEILGERIKLNC
jgi:hypothetical protein